jgi:predicted RND superfamily exporter protein
MLTILISRIVYLSSRHAWAVLGAFALLVVASSLYVARHFAITTDVGQLIDANAPWARRDAAIAAAFPNRHAAGLIIEAFVQAAVLAVVTITLLLWISFRRFGDVLLTMVPLLVSSLVTLEACVLLGTPRSPPS